MITTREDSLKTKEKGEKLQLKVRDLLRSYVMALGCLGLAFRIAV